MERITLTQNKYNFRLRFEPANKHYEIISSPVLCEYINSYSLGSALSPILTRVEIVHFFILAN